MGRPTPVTEIEEEPDLSRRRHGNCHNGGRIWCKTAEAVLVHDWPQGSIGQAIPYGIYDTVANRGFVCVGDCFDTPRFAVEAIAEWWRDEGCAAYGKARRLLILADAGGANSCRSRVWKAQLQEQLCDACGLAVTVCHYPTGCSKWNPIEHRLFAPISLNWAGVPLRSFETVARHARPARAWPVPGAISPTCCTGARAKTVRFQRTYWPVKHDCCIWPRADTTRGIEPCLLKTWPAMGSHAVQPSWHRCIPALRTATQVSAPGGGKHRRGIAGVLVPARSCCRRLGHRRRSHRVVHGYRMRRDELPEIGGPA
ncbi:ISAzo13-like element transposase-related protein [Azohydromonas lata]|uniref:ISAzo13-like element transposase-related protein n=1 Tax=Azohydromonas lata TaxID=45677 RepID=UPI003899262A